MQLRLRFATRPEEPAAARRKEPLVAVARVPVGTECWQIELELAGRVRAIYEHLGAARARAGEDLGHGPDDAGRRRNVVDDDEARAGRERGCERVHQLARIPNRDRHARLDWFRA